MKLLRGFLPEMSLSKGLVHDRHETAQKNLKALALLEITLIVSINLEIVSWI
jgi:hypothetical protein